MRYTHKLDKPDGKCNYFLTPDEEECDNAENKLGQLEDFEEEFGIDLITLFKALDEGFYGRDGKYVDPVLYCGVSGWYMRDINDPYGEHYYLNRYRSKEDGGWALTKEELK